MSKKYVQFGMDNGNLYYRNTGQYYTKRYTIKNKTVYGADGRKIGTIGKPNKTQEKKLESAKKSREKKIKRMVKKFAPKQNGFTVAELSDLYDTKPWVNVPLDRYQRELLNLSRVLNESVVRGKITVDESEAFKNKWLSCKNDSERNEIWNDLNKYFKDKGYQY